MWGGFGGGKERVTHREEAGRRHHSWSAQHRGRGSLIPESIPERGETRAKSDLCSSQQKARLVGFQGNPSGGGQGSGGGGGGGFIPRCGQRDGDLPIVTQQDNHETRGGASV